MTTPLLALLVAAVAAMSLGLGHLGGIAADRARAQTAADAAALAGAVEGEAAARELASVNGATLEHYEETADTALVVVRYDNQRAVAKAATTP
jgi:outer membrane lipoprotein SlyB